MYAVIQAGSRQFKVKEGDTLELDRVDGREGDNIKFEKVVLIGGAKTAIGSPFVSGASVEATIKAQKLAPKITVFKYKRRKNYKVTRGHRQPISVIEIGKIKA